MILKKIARFYKYLRLQYAGKPVHRAMGKQYLEGEPTNL